MGAHFGAQMVQEFLRARELFPDLGQKVARAGAVRKDDPILVRSEQTRRSSGCSYGVLDGFGQAGDFYLDVGQFGGAKRWKARVFRRLVGALLNLRQRPPGFQVAMLPRSPGFGQVTKVAHVFQQGRREARVLQGFRLALVGGCPKSLFRRCA